MSTVKHEGLVLDEAVANDGVRVSGSVSHEGIVVDPAILNGGTLVIPAVIATIEVEVC